MLRHLLITAAVASFGALMPLATHAQEQDPEQLEQELSEQFVDGFTRGCVRGVFRERNLNAFPIGPREACKRLWRR